MQNQEILKLVDLSFSYDDEPKLALDNISLTINKGEKIAILGNNGAGKSSFFLICNGILKPCGGKVFLNGEEITYKRQQLLELRKKIGIVFQDAENQIIASTVESEVSFGPMNLGLEKQQVADRVQQALQQMNLTDYKKRMPQYLSGGEKKRVCIADILAMNPEIILFDEPTASLDPQNVELLYQTLNQLSDMGITVVVSTHDVDFAYNFADRAVVFNDGKIIADDNIDAVFKQDKIIEKSGLKKPVFFEISEIFSENILKSGNIKFKNINDIQNFIKDMNIG